MFGRKMVASGRKMCRVHKILVQSAKIEADQANLKTAKNKRVEFFEIGETPKKYN